MTEHRSSIPARVYNAAVGGHVCGPEDIDFGQKVVHLIKYDRDGNEVSFESQVTQANKIYVIHDDFVLSSNVTIPTNCVLEFDGGSISGTNTLNGNNAGVLGYKFDSIMCPILNLALEITVNSIVEIADISYLHEGLVITVTKGFYGISKDVLKYRVDNSVSKGMNIGGTKVVPVFDADIANPKYYGAYGKFTDNSQNRTIDSYMTASKANTLFNFENLTQYYVSTDTLHCTIESGDEIDWIGIQAALFNINANRIYIPTGNYYINKELICRAHTTINGTNKWKTVINVIRNNINAFNCIWDRCNISDLSIYSNNYTVDVHGVTTDNGTSGIYADSRVNSIFRNVEIYGFTYGINFGINSWNSKAEHCDVCYCNTGINFGSEANNISVDKCVILHCIVGISTGGTYSMGANITATTIESNNLGIELKDGFYGIISGCYFENNGGELYDSQCDIYVYSQLEEVAVSAVIIGCYFFIGTTVPYLHQSIIVNGSTHNIEVTNCKFRASSSREQNSYGCYMNNGAKVAWNFNSLIDLFGVERTHRNLNDCQTVFKEIDGKATPTQLNIDGLKLYKFFEQGKGNWNIFTIFGRVKDYIYGNGKIEINTDSKDNIAGYYIGDTPLFKVYYEFSGDYCYYYIKPNVNTCTGWVTSVFGNCIMEESDKDVSQLTEIQLTSLNLSA